MLDELVEPQGPVVERGREPEAVLDERLLAGPVTLVLSVQLRDGHVRLVEHAEEVVGEVVEQGVRHLAGFPTVEEPRVVLDPGAGADLAEHLEVVGRPHPQPLRFQQFALRLEPRQSVRELGFDALDRPLHVVLVGDVVRRREQHEPVELLDDLAGDGVDRVHPLDLVPEELDAHAPFLVGGEHLDRVPSHPELVADEALVIAFVLELDEPAQDRALVVLLAHAEHEALLLVQLG